MPASTFGLLKRTWIPLLVVVVVVIAGFTVYRLHGVFGSHENPATPRGISDDAKPFNPKRVRYEVWGPAGAVATINYLDIDAQPQRVDDAALPWSITMTTTAPAVGANVIAQGDSDAIGCRIIVNDEVKDEKTSTGVSAQTFCLVKSA